MTADTFIYNMLDTYALLVKKTMFRLCQCLCYTLYSPSDCTIARYFRVGRCLMRQRSPQERGSPVKRNSSIITATYSSSLQLSSCFSFSFHSSNTHHCRGGFPSQTASRYWQKWRVLSEYHGQNGACDSGL